MNNGEGTGFTDDELAIINSSEGKPKDNLKDAYESFAEEVGINLARMHGVERLDENYFEDRPFIKTFVYVKSSARNNWVKEYWVKAY